MACRGSRVDRIGDRYRGDRSEMHASTWCYWRRGELTCLEEELLRQLDTASVGNSGRFETRILVFWEALIASTWYD